MNHQQALSGHKAIAISFPYSIFNADDIRAVSITHQSEFKFVIRSSEGLKFSNHLTLYLSAASDTIPDNLKTIIITVQFCIVSCFPIQY